LAVLLLAQEPRVVPNRPACSRCTIQITYVVTLESEDIVEGAQAMSEDSRGRYYITQPNKQELPLVFDASGRRIAALGTSGEGPGEFRYAAIISVDPRTDTIFVTDWGTARLSVFSPQFNFVRSVPFPARARALGVLRDGNLVAMANIPDRASVGLPFHVFRRNGLRLRAIGDPGRPYTPERDVFFYHRIGPSRRGGFWAVPTWGDYRIEHWTAAGVRDVYLLRRPDWHTALRPGVGNPESIDPPPSSHGGIAETESGLLWVLSQVGDPNRRNAPLDTLRTVEGQFVVPADGDRAWDSVIELIDPVQGIVIAAQRFDMRFTRILPSGKLSRVIETDRGLAFQMFEPRLAQGN